MKLKQLYSGIFIFQFPYTKDHNQSHSILVDENQSTCTSNHSTAPSVANVLDLMDAQLHFTS